MSAARRRRTSSHSGRRYNPHIHEAFEAIAATLLAHMTPRPPPVSVGD